MKTEKVIYFAQQCGKTLRVIQDMMTQCEITEKDARRTLELIRKGKLPRWIALPSTKSPAQSVSSNGQNSAERVDEGDSQPNEA